MDEGQRYIGVAFSGGGHRATIFSLGAAMALSDVGLNRSVRSISSVSGGSIANGVLLVGGDYGTSDPAQIRVVIARASKAIAERGILLGRAPTKPSAFGTLKTLITGAPATRWYLRALLGTAALAIGGLIAAWVVAGVNRLIAAVLVVFAAGAAALGWRLFRQRSARVAAAVDAELLGGRKVLLNDGDLRTRSVHHVVCTTELQSGTQMYLTNRAVYGWQHGGAAHPASIRVAQAVQASAAVPGAFAPVELEAGPLGLSGTKRVVLSDGGVYDNMGDEWEYGFAGRLKSWPELADAQDSSASMLVIVNGSGGWNALKPIGRRGRAVELAGLLRAKDVQYDVSTSQRRRALFDRFLDAESGVKGVFVQITASPFAIIDSFARRGDESSARSAHARIILTEAGYTPEWWKGLTSANAALPTTLAALGHSAVADLLEHGYVLTAVQLFVVHGLGTLEHLPDRSLFSTLARGAMQ
jgi:predicted acylesterase/phospholipase RssA